MEILLTGANGYIGLRLLPALLEAGHSVKGLVRDKGRFPSQQFADFLADGRLELIEGDMLKPESLPELSGKADAAYYLLHSMGAGKGFGEREEACARNFMDWISGRCRKVIYLGGLVPEGGLSGHLRSRESVNRILRGGDVPVTTLRASIIVGSGSASFEIIRDLAEKLPVMLTPKWAWTRCQPVAIRNVIGYLTGCLDCVETEGEEFDIGGPARQKLLKVCQARLCRGLMQACFVAVDRRDGATGRGIGGWSCRRGRRDAGPYSFRCLRDRRGGAFALCCGDVGIGTIQVAQDGGSEQECSDERDGGEQAPSRRAFPRLLLRARRVLISLRGIACQSARVGEIAA